jgi:hypothetical protein
VSDWRKEVKRDSKFLYWFDIWGKSPVTVTITGHERAEAYCPGKGEKGSLWCLTFKGAQKMLGLNVTNGYLIQHHHGPELEGWIGKQIILRVAECEGERCIRVHATGAKLPKQIRKFRYLDAEPGAKAPSKPAPAQAAPAAGRPAAAAPLESGCGCCATGPPAPCASRRHAPRRGRGRRSARANPR